MDKKRVPSRFRLPELLCICVTLLQLRQKHLFVWDVSVIATGLCPVTWHRFGNHRLLMCLSSKAFHVGFPHLDPCELCVYCMVYILYIMILYYVCIQSSQGGFPLNTRQHIGNLTEDMLSFTVIFQCVCSMNLFHRRELAILIHGQPFKNHRNSYFRVVSACSHIYIYYSHIIAVFPGYSIPENLASQNHQKSRSRSLCPPSDFSPGSAKELSLSANSGDGW